MHPDHNLDGRIEKRLDLAIVVRLSRMKHWPANGDERTFTDNVSTHGARVVSRHPWQPGDQAQVTPLKEEAPIRGKVVYCQRLDVDRYGVGLRFLERPVMWSMFRAYARP